MIHENVARLKERVEAACRRSGRSPDEVRIVAVVKNRKPWEIQDVLAAGLTDIAENRMQEAILHSKDLWAAPGSREALVYHFIGHLQSNKVREAVDLFDIIHSVDSLRLAEALDAEAARRKKVQDVLVQVNTSEEASKFGISPEALKDLLGQMLKLEHLCVRGLMTIGPIVEKPEQARTFFSHLRRLRDDSVSCKGVSGSGFSQLSMGMTDDFEVAIEEGSTLIRIGRAIFKE